MGVVEAVHPEGGRQSEDDAIEAGAQNVEELEAEEVPEGHTGATFLTDPKDLAAVSKALAAMGWKLQASELRYLAKTFPELTEAQHEEVSAFLAALDDHGDVHRVYAALK
jgi:transcriptional/translational regulatory protein YebC/TACO1